MSKGDSITAQMSEILKEYTDELDSVVEKATEKVPKKTAQTLKSSSPKKSGDYARGWRVKKLDKKAAVVYNATAPGLTHLLEHGHVTRNKRGTFGRTDAHPHIKPAEEAAVTEYINEIERKL